MTNLGPLSGALAVAIQGDGKIVAAGVGGDIEHETFALVRYMRDGHLDS